MQIIPLSEGSFTVGKDKNFVAFDEKKDLLQTRPAGSLLVEVQPFIVITSNDIILLDTGLGFTDREGRMQIHSNLAKEGINPADITKVLLTHLHKDHAGGVSTGSGHSNLSFPGASYYIQERELNFAFEKGFPTYITAELQVLKNNSQVVLLKEDEGRIDNYIHYRVTAAHSSAHQVFTISEMGEIIFFGGDDAPQLQQMRHRFVAKYDFDGKKTMNLRQEWWERGEREGWTFLFYHDIKTPIFNRNRQFF